MMTTHLPCMNMHYRMAQTYVGVAYTQPQPATHHNALPCNVPLHHTAAYGMLRHCVLCCQRSTYTTTRRPWMLNTARYHTTGMYDTAVPALLSLHCCSCTAVTVLLFLQPT